LAVQVLMDIIKEKHGGNGRVICCHPHPGKNLTPENNNNNNNDDDDSNSNNKSHL